MHTKIGGRNLQFQEPGHAKPWEEVGKLDSLYLLYLLKYLYKSTFKKRLSKNFLELNFFFLVSKARSAREKSSSNVRETHTEFANGNNLATKL